MDEKHIREKLTEAGLRITYPRLALINELTRTHEPQSAAELSETLSQFPRSSIYRNLDVLEKALLIKSSMIKWVRRYELGDLLAPHHHHITCTQCGSVKQFDSPKLEKHLINTAQDNDFQLTSHVVELRGLCSSCNQAPQTISTARSVFRSVKRFKQHDPIMEKLTEEDDYHSFIDGPPNPPSE